MKYAKGLGLAATVLATMLALAATAPAATLTSPSGTSYTGFVEAQSSNATLTSAFGGFGSVSCSQSRIRGSVNTHGALSSARLSLSILSFSFCSGGAPTDPAAKPGTLEIHNFGANTGQVTSLNAEVIVHNTSLGTCTFVTDGTGDPIGFLTGSANSTSKASLSIKGTLRGISGFCGNATWEGSYTVTTPVPLFID